MSDYLQFREKEDEKRKALFLSNYYLEIHWRVSEVQLQPDENFVSSGQIFDVISREFDHSVYSIDCHNDIPSNLTKDNIDLNGYIRGGIDGFNLEQMLYLDPDDPLVLRLYEKHGITFNNVIKLNSSKIFFKEQVYLGSFFDVRDNNYPIP